MANCAGNFFRGSFPEAGSGGSKATQDLPTSHEPPRARRPGGSQRPRRLTRPPGGHPGLSDLSRSPRGRLPLATGGPRGSHETTLPGPPTRRLPQGPGGPRRPPRRLPQPPGGHEAARRSPRTFRPPLKATAPPSYQRPGGGHTERFWVFGCLWPFGLILGLWAGFGHVAGFGLVSGLWSLARFELLAGLGLLAGFERFGPFWACGWFGVFGWLWAFGWFCAFWLVLGRWLALGLWLVLSFWLAWVLGAGFAPLGWFWALGVGLGFFNWFCAFCWLWAKVAGADWGWGQELGAAGWAWPGLD